MTTCKWFAHYTFICSWFLTHWIATGQSHSLDSNWGVSQLQGWWSPVPRKLTCRFKKEKLTREASLNTDQKYPNTKKNMPKPSKSLTHSEQARLFKDSNMLIYFRTCHERMIGNSFHSLHPTIQSHFQGATRAHHVPAESGPVHPTSPVHDDAAGHLKFIQFWGSKPSL